MMRSKKLGADFRRPPASSPSTAPNDPQTSRAAQRHSPAATHPPKPPLQIPALLRKGPEAGSCGPPQTILCPVGKSALFASHLEVRALICVLSNLCQVAFSKSIAQSHTPRQIPALRRLVSPVG